jgi:RNA polymerase sigma-70 factor (ECF subfamily)
VTTDLPRTAWAAAGDDELMPSDAEVVIASLEQPEAFGAIFDRHATALHRYLVRRVGADEARRAGPGALARLAQARSDVHAADDAAARLDAELRWPHVADALTRLPDGERDALLLYAWEELTYDEIAAALDIPVGTVRSRLNRARRRLRELPAVSGREDHE